MKKVNNSKNNDNKMSKNTSKKVLNKNVVEAVSEWVLDTLSSSLSKEQLENVRETFDSKKNDLNNIISNNKNTSSKKVKDPNAPKRAKTSYILFCAEQRDNVKKSHPDMSAKDIIKELGRLWRDTPDEKKQKYIKMSENDKERYTGELVDYLPTNKEKPAGPKRSLTAYIYFCKEHRGLITNEDSSLSTKDITTELGKRWKSLTDKQKLPYVKLAEEDKSRYNNEKSQTKSTKEEKPVTKKSTSKKSTSKKSAPKKSGYDIFCEESVESLKEEHPKWSNQQLTKELDKHWNNLSKEEQDEYDESV